MCYWSAVYVDSVYNNLFCLSMKVAKQGTFYIATRGERGKSSNNDMYSNFS